MTRDILFRSLYFVLSISLFAVALPARAQQSFVVNDGVDLPDLSPGDGVCATSASTCTLRAAIEEANTTANIGAAADTIRFTHLAHVNGFATTLVTNLPLPAITEKVFIDATTAGEPIVVDGGGMWPTAFTLAAGSNGSTLRGVYLVNFWKTAVTILSNNTKVQNNAIGFFPDGSAAGSTENGIQIVDGDNNTIGGVNRGNFLGYLTGVGIEVQGGADNKIQGNFIGTDELGTDRGGQNNGLFISEGAENTLVGGTTASLGNTIGYSFSGQIDVFGSTGTTIQNNFIGTNAAGTDMGSVGDGITVRDTMPNPSTTTIGGTSDVGNTIGFNGNGVLLLNVQDVIIQGNSIGVTRQGDPVGNVGRGIVVMAPSSNITIGYGATTAIPADAPLGNAIARNGAEGVLVGETYLNPQYASGVSIRGNRIRNNTENGIALAAGGIGANDAGDLDAGNNRRQNHPSLVSANIVAATGRLRIRYSVSTSLLAATYPLKVDFYEADNATSGEGKRYLGTHTYTTALSTVTVTVDTTGKNLNAGDYLVATATDAVGNTSEFSLAMAIAFPVSPSAQGLDAAAPGLSVTADNAPTDALGAAYPNPFNPQTSFSLSLAEATPVRIAVYDAVGRQVALLHDGELSASTHNFTFDGAGLATGVYLLRVQTSRFVESRRLMLVK